MELLNLTCIFPVMQLSLVLLAHENNSSSAFLVSHVCLRTAHVCTNPGVLNQLNKKNADMEKGVAFM